MRDSVDSPCHCVPGIQDNAFIVITVVFASRHDSGGVDGPSHPSAITGSLSMESVLWKVAMSDAVAVSFWRCNHLSSAR